MALGNGMSPSTPLNLNECEINVCFCFALYIKAVTGFLPEKNLRGEDNRPLFLNK